MTNVEDVNGRNLFPAGGQAPFVVFTRSHCCWPHRVLRTLGILQAAKHCLWICASFKRLEVDTAVSIYITVFRNAVSCTLVECYHVSEESAASIFRVKDKFIQWKGGLGSIASHRVCAPVHTCPNAGGHEIGPSWAIHLQQCCPTFLYIGAHLTDGCGDAGAVWRLQ
jgi:hypothetical protein